MTANSFRDVIQQTVVIFLFQLSLFCCFIAKVSSTEVLRVGSTSGAKVANVSNIDVFEVGANIVLLS